MQTCSDPKEQLSKWPAVPVYLSEKLELFVKKSLLARVAACLVLPWLIVVPDSALGARDKDVAKEEMPEIECVLVVRSASPVLPTLRLGCRCARAKISWLCATSLHISDDDVVIYAEIGWSRSANLTVSVEDMRHIPAFGLMFSCLPRPSEPLSPPHIFKNESPEETRKRLEAWKVRALDLALAVRPKYCISAWPLQPFGSTGLMARSVFYSDARTLVVPLVQSNGWEISQMSKLDALKAQISECRVPARQKCACKVASNNLMVLCQVSSRVDWKDRQAWITSALVFPKAGNMTLPIEFFSPRHRNGGVHVCLQGHLYPDAQLGAATDEYLESFIAHYASLNVSHVHLYSQSFAANIDAVARIKSPSSTTQVWVHDSSFPPLAEGRQVTGVQRKFQSFAVSDCIMRSRAMGAQWAAIVDIDELIAFHSPQHQNNFELALLDKSLESRLVVWMPSFLFNTALCGAAGSGSLFDDKLTRFQFALRDTKTYLERRKALIQVGKWPSVDALAQVRLSTHQLSIAGGPQVFQASQDLVHLHHVRDPWHKKICESQVQGEPPPPPAWQKHISDEEALARKALRRASMEKD